MKNTRSTNRTADIGSSAATKHFLLILILTAGFIFISPANISAQGKAAGVIARMILKRAATKAAAKAAAKRAAARAAARNSMRTNSRNNARTNRTYNPGRANRPPGQKTYRREMETVVNYCNYTGEPTIYVAIGHTANYSDDWISRGWFQISNGTCKSVPIGMNYSGYVYQYAVNQDSSLVWKGVHNFYINKYEAFKLRQSDSSFGYGENYKTVGMSEFRVSPGTNNYRFR